MRTDQIAAPLGTLFSELTEGAPGSGAREAFILNTGDAGLLRSLDALGAEQASANVHGGATVAAHARHLQYGLSLMNRWALEGGNPFADARWEQAWKTTRVSDAEWAELRAALRAEVTRWLEQLRTPREASPVELTGMIGSVAHLAYHLGAIRQIVSAARGPKEGSYAS